MNSALQQLLYERCFPIVSAVEAMKKEKDKIVICIEGRCGAGKTTISAVLARLLEAEVIHMDDFFLPPSLRTQERLGQAGGNIHYERFREEVISGIKKEGSYEYRIFDCSIQDYSRKVAVSETAITIVEGVYSMHPKLTELYDYKIFCDITKAEQQKRLRKREGEEGYRQFEQRWIPMEEKYFQKYNIDRKCNFCL